MGIPLLEVIDVAKIYPDTLSLLDRVAVDGINIELQTGESMGIIGQSGAGKSTLGRLLLGIEQPTRGMIRIEGKTCNGKTLRIRRELRQKIQIIWQDPVIYLNPYLTAQESVSEALEVSGVHRTIRTKKTAELFEKVYLPLSLMRRKPHELSGGQAQRVAIARALAMEPKILICDEALTSLDLPIQQHIIALLMAIRQETGMSLIFISHDITPITRLCDYVAVMAEGKIVEQGVVQKVLSKPSHQITSLLISCEHRIKARQHFL